MTNGKRSALYGSDVWCTLDLSHGIMHLWEKGQDSDFPVCEPYHTWNISVLFVFFLKRFILLLDSAK